MNINVEHQSNCRAIVHLHASADEVAKHRNGIVAYHARGLKLPGYRPGKVPAAVVMKRYGAAINEELERQIASEGLQTAVRNESLNVLNVIGITDKMHHDNDQSFTCNVEVSLAPKFELPDYKGIPVKLPRVEVTDADIDHDLLHLREHHQTYVDVERAAATGDVVVISYEAFLDSQPVAEAMPEAPEHLRALTEQWFLLDAEDDFLPGFYTGLTGIRAGEQRDVEVTLPEDFAFEPLRGKTLKLQAACSAVKEKNLPELDEEFIKKVGGDEMTAESLREEVREAVRRRREQARDTSKTNQVLEHLASKLEFELPQEVVNRAAQRRTNEIAQNAMRQGVSSEELMNQQEAILNTATQQARQNVKISFILGEVARAENLQVADAQLQMALAQLAARSQMPVKKYLVQAQKQGVIDGLREDLLLQNAIEFIKDNAAVEETDPESEHCETHSPKAEG